MAVGSSYQLCDAGRLRKSRVNCIRGHGFAEEMPLSFVTTMGFDLPHLLFGLDAFRNNCLVEACAEAGDGTDDRLRVALLAQPLNE